VEAPAPDLAKLQRQFLASLAGKSPKTQSTYATGLGNFVEYLTSTDGEAWTPAQLEPTTLEEYYAWLVRRHGREARSTLTTYLSGARSFLRFLDRRALLPSDVSYERLRANLQEAMGRTPSYRSPRIDRRIPLIVTHVSGLPLPAPTERKGARRLEVLRDQALIQVLFGTGMRREEVARLNRQDVEEGYADRALIVGKGDKERVVFFDEQALAAIRAYLAARGDTYQPLFLRHDNRRGKTPGPGASKWRLSPQSIWYLVKQYSRATGVPASTHHFRHAKASTLLNRGASLSEVQDILGHSSPETTKRIYAHYKVQHLRDAFDKYSATAEELAEELDTRRKAAAASS
jgi:site-specific recombinase XerD